MALLMVNTLSLASKPVPLSTLAAFPIWCISHAVTAVFRLRAALGSQVSPIATLVALDTTVDRLGWGPCLQWTLTVRVHRAGFGEVIQHLMDWAMRQVQVIAYSVANSD
jgi:hypothetical protein